MIQFNPTAVVSGRDMPLPEAVYTHRVLRVKFDKSREKEQYYLMLNTEIVDADGMTEIELTNNVTGEQMRVNIAGVQAKALLSFGASQCNESLLALERLGIPDVKTAGLDPNNFNPNVLIGTLFRAVTKGKTTPKINAITKQAILNVDGKAMVDIENQVWGRDVLNKIS